MSLKQGTSRSDLAPAARPTNLEYPKGAIVDSVSLFSIMDPQNLILHVLTDCSR